MSFMNKKTRDVILEEHSAFGYRMTLTDVETVCSEHPITKEPMNCKEVRTPIDMSNSTLKGDIANSLDDGATILGSFTFTMLDASNGVAEMTLTKDQVNTLVALASDVREPYDPRFRFLGFYDVVLTEETTGTPTRLFQGKVFVSDGVTA